MSGFLSKFMCSLFNLGVARSARLSRRYWHVGKIKFVTSNLRLILLLMKYHGADSLSMFSKTRVVNFDQFFRKHKLLSCCQNEIKCSATQ